MNVDEIILSGLSPYFIFIARQHSMFSALDQASTHLCLLLFSYKIGFRYFIVYVQTCQMHGFHFQLII